MVIKTNKQKEKSELKHLESHAQNKPMKFKKLTKKGLDILNQLSLQINLDKDKLKKADKELKDYDVLMEICFKLSLDPIDDKINEIKGVLIKKILEKNKKVLK